MSEIHTHAIDDHHVTRCLHDHAHGKSQTGSMGMQFTVPDSVSQELSLEQRLEMLLADLKDTSIVKSFRGFGARGNSLADSSGQATGDSVLLTPLAEAGTEQGKTQGQISHHTLVPLLPAQSQEHEPLSRRSGGRPGQESTFGRQNTTLSNKDDENKRQPHSSSVKTRKKRPAGWISMDTDGLEVKNITEMQALPIKPAPEAFLTGCYDAQGFLSQRVRDIGVAMDRKG